MCRYFSGGHNLNHLCSQAFEAQGSCSFKLPDWRKTIEKSSGLLVAIPLWDEKDRLSRFRAESAGNECQGFKELIGETYVHPHFHLRLQACSSSDKPHRRFQVTPENRN